MRRKGRSKDSPRDDKKVLLQIAINPGEEVSETEIRERIEAMLGMVTPPFVISGLRRVDGCVEAAIVSEEMYRRAKKQGPKALAELVPWVCSS